MSVFIKKSMGKILKQIIFQIYKLLTNLLWGTNISRFSIIRKIHTMMMKNFKPTVVCLDGFNIYLDEYDGTSLSTVGLKKQLHLINLLKKSVHSGDTAVDVGANNGLETLQLSRLVGNTGCVFSFEPEEKNFQILQKNVENNNLKNVTILNMAVANETAEKYLELGRDAATHRLVENKNSENLKLVKCTRLDAITKKIDFAKIDAEGYDYHVLLGMGDLIKNPDLRLIIEFQPKLLIASGTDPIEFLKFLKDNSFIIYDTEFQNEQLIPVTNFTKLTEYYSQKDPHITDLYCVKTDKLKSNTIS